MSSASYGSKYLTLESSKIGGFYTEFNKFIINKFMSNFWKYMFNWFRTNWFLQTPVLSTSGESTRERSLVKNYSFKSIPGESVWIFYLPDNLHNLSYPVEDIGSLIVPSDIFTFTWVSLDITPVILLSPWCMPDYDNPWQLFFRNIKLNFLVWWISYHFFTDFYGELGTGCYVLKNSSIRTVLMKNFLVIVRN